MLRRWIHTWEAQVGCEAFAQSVKMLAVRPNLLESAQDAVPSSFRGPLVESAQGPVSLHFQTDRFLGRVLKIEDAAVLTLKSIMMKTGNGVKYERGPNGMLRNRQRTVPLSLSLPEP